MTVNKQLDGETLTMTISGRIDSVTSQELQAIVDSSLQGVSHLVIDLANVEYVSSAGLRVILSAHKIMSRQGTMNLVRVPDFVREIFEITGFDSVLNIEY